ncbi:MCE family protein [Rhodococcus sp. 14-2483-1-2]|uniref:MCE family protein n=1 Tax=Rhodococcus sp. 14-2483-1-2 TaxID=2023147 RepID=UPI00207B2792|nr:MCE family protein [Rhodococcus sp. 14-2483-1-2]
MTGPNQPAPRRLGPGRSMLVFRGIVASCTAVVAAVASVAYSSGTFDSAPEVSVVLPATAGLLTGEIGVQYLGVRVGEVVDIEPGVDRSRVTMRIDADRIGTVPASARVRVVPRTLFGDIYIQLVAVDRSSSSALADGMALQPDASADAVQASDLFRTVTDLLDGLEPDQAQLALTALGTALRGRGQSIGESIDRLASVTDRLEPGIEAALSRMPQLRELTENIAAATPDVLASVAAATRVSQTLLDRSDGVRALLTAAAGTVESTRAVVAENRSAAITVVHSGGAALGALAQDSDGLTATLDRLGPFGEAGARIFASGKFDVTAVPDFSEPLPYTAADCPQYPGLAGPNCALAELQDAATGTSLPLNPASTLLLAPLLRGTEVTVR